MELERVCSSGATGHRTLQASPWSWLRWPVRVTLLHLALVLPAAIVPASPLAAQERGELGIAVGSTVAPVVVEDLDGNPADLGEYLGQGPMLLEFWASWCENCRALQPRMDAAHAAWGDQVAFVAIAVAVNQTPRRVRRHIDKEPIPYAVLWDDGGGAVRAFFAPATSYVVVLDSAGTVTYTGIGPDQDIDAAVRTALD